MSSAGPQGEGCHGNAAPYVLGALTAAEHSAFERHLETCAVCREEVASLQQVAAALAGAAPRYEAPPELRRRVMSVVRKDARRRAPRGRAVLRGSIRHRRPLVVQLTLAAAVAVLLALLLTGGSGSRVVRARVSLPGASAVVRISGDHAELQVSHMPSAGRGRVYEIWLVRSSAPAPTDALFTPSRSGSAALGLPGSIAGVRELLVTSEPLGGSRKPTRAPVLAAKIA